MYYANKKKYQVPDFVIFNWLNHKGFFVKSFCEMILKELLSAVAKGANLRVFFVTAVVFNIIKTLPRNPLAGNLVLSKN